MKKRNVIFGIVLIALGLIWLLSNMDILNFDLFILIDSLFDLWPLILIVIGINIIFKNKILNTALWIIFIIIVIAYGFFINDTNDVKNDYSEDLLVKMSEGIIKGELDIDLGAAKYNINSYNSQTSLAKISSNNRFNHNYESGTSNNSQRVNVSNDMSNNIFNNKSNLDIDINNKLIWNIDVDSGASSGKLNLKNVKVQKIDLDLGAGKMDIDFGDLHSTSYVNIESGASSIVLNVPTDAGLKIEMDGALNSTNIDDLGLIESEEDVLISKDYVKKDTNFDIKVDMGVGSFKINRY
ncbi:MAG: LiaI-LiaF-like domain-containing protein [Senegalia sp. (in: firmicutes)]|uniref:LiaI-LiaF-like domain-containing protein n=1 Tax=Senegalia sp. (in: firmicutes) TaxID=1924098 RepID=UPI003F99823B